MASKSTTRKPKAPSKTKKTSRSRGDDYPDDIDAAEVARSRKAAILQLRMGRLGHVLGIVSGLALAATAVLAYLLENWSYLVNAPEYVTALKWALPLVAGLVVAVVALVFKWEPYFADHTEPHFLVGFAAVAVSALFMALIALDEAGHLAIGRPDWLYPASLLGMSLAMISLAMSWEGRGSRKVVSMVSAAFPPALLTFPIMVHFTPLELASILPMAYLGSAVAFQLSGSMLHIIASATSVQEREVLKASDGKLKVLLDEVDKHMEAIEYREDAMRSRESDLEAYEKRLMEEMDQIDDQKRQARAMEAEAEIRVDHARKAGEELARKEADVEGRLDALRLTQADLEIQRKEQEKAASALADREQKLASKDAELNKLVLDAQAKEREVGNKLSEVKALEAELGIWDKDLHALQKALAGREKQVSVRESSVELKGLELLAEKEQLGTVAAEKTDVRTFDQQLRMRQEALSEREIALKAKEDELRKASERAERLIARSDKQMNELVDKESVVLRREKELAEKEAELRAALSDLSVRLEEAKRAKASVADREKQYLSMTDAARSKAADASAKEQEVERRMAALERRESSIRDLETRLKAEQDQMNSKLRLLLEKEKDLKAGEAKISLKHAELHRMERDTLRSVEDVERARHPGPAPGGEPSKTTELRERRLREKEQEMKARLYQREKELERREQALQAHLRKDIDVMETEVQAECAGEKVKTGIERLDDLLMGGIPFSSNVLFIGPPFIGKETAMLLFVAEGLKKGVPAVIVTTSRPPDEIASDMAPILPTFMEFEQLGLVHWVDASGLAQEPGRTRRNVHTVKGADDFAGISKAVSEVLRGTLAGGEAYVRMVYLSLSMSVTSAGEKKALQFVQELAGRVRQAESIALYAVDKGMHTEQQLGSIQAQMTGAMHFRTEKQKTILSVEGVGDAQTRNWVEYRHTNKSLMIGAFSLERIR